MPSPIPQTAQTHPYKNEKAVVKNPYLKKEQATATTAICSKRKFVAKYSHSTKCVEGITAAELRRKRVRKREAITTEIDDGPRLCLFRRGSQCNNVDDGVYPLESDITELSGEGGSGKTQVCLSLVVDCVLRRHRGAVKECYDNNLQSATDCPHQNNTIAIKGPLHPKAIYITTKSSISMIAARLQTMIHARLSSQPTNEALESQITSQTITTLQNIHLIPIQNEEQLMEFIVSSLPNLMKRLNVHLVVLDDIAALYRFSDPSPNVFDNSSTTFVRDRSGDLWTISSILRSLASLHQCPMVVVNQVTAIPPSLEGGSLSSGSWEGNSPALGLVWSYCVGTRIMLRRGHVVGTKVDGEKEGQRGGMGKSIRKRFAHILQAVNVPIDQEVGFVVEDDGVRLEK